MPRLGIVISALVAGVVFGLAFKTIYPSVELSPALALLFALAGLITTFALRALWQKVRSQPE